MSVELWFDHTLSVYRALLVQACGDNIAGGGH